MASETRHTESREKIKQKLNYLPPKLVLYGQVAELTRANGQSGYEANCGNAFSDPGTRVCSDPSTKQNGTRVGTHHLGIGLYLFDYKPEFRDQWGHGRQFGVMADEVETVLPEAVSLHPDGYNVVDYSMLGISRAPN